MKGARTVRKEVAERLNGPGARPPDDDQVNRHLAAGDGPGLRASLESLAAAVGLPEDKIDDAIAKFCEHCLSFGVDADSQVSDAVVQRFFAVYAHGLKNPPKKLSDAEGKILSKRIGAGTANAGGTPND